MLTRTFVAVIALLAITIAATVGADAACTRLAFSVNDYGKDGPIKDANKLLDKYVADWTRERGIKGYSVSKRDVSCELFLDLIVFDEHTCKASALVCWPGKAPSDDKTPASKPASKGKPAG
jgi:hypothetical protein